MTDFLEDFLGEASWSEAEIRLLVCDDHALFRRGLIATIEEESDLEVLGEAADADEAVDLAEELAPDVVLMDVRMPGGGIDATRRITDLVPGTRVIMLTVSDDPDDLLEAVKAGAAGYLLKEVSAAEVAAAVRSVHAGQSPMSPMLADKLMAEFVALDARAQERPAPPKLAPRELEVLRLVADGKSNRVIAEELGISPNTVKNHVGNILEKLQLHSRTEAAMYAVREKLLDIS